MNHKQPGANYNRRLGEQVVLQRNMPTLVLIQQLIQDLCEGFLPTIYHGQIGFARSTHLVDGTQLTEEFITITEPDVNTYRLVGVLAAWFTFYYPALALSSRQDEILMIACRQGEIKQESLSTQKAYADWIKNSEQSHYFNREYAACLALVGLLGKKDIGPEIAVRGKLLLIASLERYIAMEFPE